MKSSEWPVQSVAMETEAVKAWFGHVTPREQRKAWSTHIEPTPTTAGRDVSGADTSAISLIVFTGA